MKTNAFISQAEMQLIQKNDPEKRLTDKDQSISFVCVRVRVHGRVQMHVSADSVHCKVHIKFSSLSMRVFLRKEWLLPPLLKT